MEKKKRKRKINTKRKRKRKPLSLSPIPAYTASTLQYLHPAYTSAYHLLLPCLPARPALRRKP